MTLVREEMTFPKNTQESYVIDMQRGVYVDSYSISH